MQHLIGADILETTSKTPMKMGISRCFGELFLSLQMAERVRAGVRVYILPCCKRLETSKPR